MSQDEIQCTIRGIFIVWENITMYLRRCVWKHVLTFMRSGRSGRHQPPSFISQSLRQFWNKDEGTCKSGMSLCSVFLHGAYMWACRPKISFVGYKDDNFVWRCCVYVKGIQARFLSSSLRSSIEINHFIRYFVSLILKSLCVNEQIPCLSIYSWVQCQSQKIN